MCTSLDLTLSEYAELPDQSVWMVRAKVRRGELSAMLVKGGHAPNIEYRIPHPKPGTSVAPPLDNPSNQTSATVVLDLDQPDARRSWWQRVLEWVTQPV